MTELHLQAGCLPYRGEPPQIEVLLVTSRYTGEWIVPKGGVEPGESSKEAARRETEEEAGVRGRMVRRLGVFFSPRGSGVARIEVFLLQVDEVLRTWPEVLCRQRRWFRLEEALHVVQRPAVLAMLRALDQRSGRPGSCE